MYILESLFDLVDVVCLQDRWTLKITQLGLVGGGGGVPAVLGGVSVVVTYQNTNSGGLFLARLGDPTHKPATMGRCR